MGRKYIPELFVLTEYRTPVSSFAISTEASGMKLPVESVTPPLMVALVDWERAQGGARQRTSSKRQGNRFMRRCSGIWDERCSSCLRLSVEICISCLFDFTGDWVESEGTRAEV